MLFSERLIIVQNIGLPAKLILKNLLFIIKILDIQEVKCSKFAHIIIQHKHYT